MTETRVVEEHVLLVCTDGGSDKFYELIAYRVPRDDSVLGPLQWHTRHGRRTAMDTPGGGRVRYGSRSSPISHALHNKAEEKRRGGYVDAFAATIVGDSGASYMTPKEWEAARADAQVREAAASAKRSAEVIAAGLRKAASSSGAAQIFD